MPWGRLNDQANGDAKLLALSDPAWRMWGAGLIYCQANLTDGFIPDHAIHSFGVRARNKAAIAEELCRAMVPGKGPLWHKVDGGWQVHDYHDWNDSRVEVLAEREKARKRMERIRGGGKRSRERSPEQNGEQIAELPLDRSGVHVPQPLPQDVQTEERLNGEPAKKPHPIRDLLEQFAAKYAEVFGARPHINNRKDPQMLSGLLDQHDPERVSAALSAFMEDNYARKAGFPLPLFISQFNRFLAVSVPAKSKQRADSRGHTPPCDSPEECSARFLRELREQAAS